jgi:hypothetical protein
MLTRCEKNAPGDSGWGDESRPALARRREKRRDKGHHGLVGLHTTMLNSSCYSAAINGITLKAD